MAKPDESLRHLLQHGGLVVIDKPRGPSSHQVTSWIGNILGVRVGHAGTLDPGVSGILTIMTGKAVRLAPILLSEEKEYVCLLRLHGDIPIERIAPLLCEFSGRIYQRPPRKSAVARNLRLRMVHKIDLLDSDNRLLLVRIECDAGTYVRSLCHHIGLALGVGAHMVELRRTRSGHFNEDQACTIGELADAVALARLGDSRLLHAILHPPQKALASLPGVVLKDTAVDAICHGAVLAKPGMLRADEFEKGDVVAMTTSSGELVALGRTHLSSREIESLKSGLVISPSTVFMEPGTYAKCWKKHTQR